MRIFNVRLGLATNSSSSHSLIFLNNQQDVDAEGDFGWGFFTAASRKSKQHYLAVTLLDSLRRHLSAATAKAVVREWMRDADSSIFDEAGRPNGYIDHQSVITLPSAWDGAGVDDEFFRDFSDFMLQDDLVILGGNDNTDETHPLALGEDFRLPLPLEADSTSFVARKDPEHQYWSLFNRSSGSKIRFSFIRNAVAPNKAFAPELVDVKITDYCSYKGECSKFCYQASDEGGQHADMNAIYYIAEALGRLKVFEVALGGGETTSHPKFVEILEYFRSKGIVPNFTTKSFVWLQNSAIRTRVLKAAGAFAYSVTAPEEVTKLARLIKLHKISGMSINLQYVMGSTNEEVFGQICAEALKQDLRLTLLGYKTTGFGAAFTPHPYRNWIAIVQAASTNRWIRVGIDTALAAEFEQELLANGVSGALFHTKEGKFSMYVDAVSSKAGPSSFADDRLYLPMKLDYGNSEQEIRRVFATF